MSIGLHWIIGWLTGYSGIPGNEEADRLTDAGRYIEPENVPMPLGDAIRWSEGMIHEIWSRQWINSRNFALRRVKQNAYSPSPILTTQKPVSDTRLTLGHYLTKEDFCIIWGVQLSISQMLL